MGKNKKPFIDKKKASTYHLLYRSQRDVTDAGTEDENENGNGGVILWPSPNNKRETDIQVLLGKKGTNKEDVREMKDDTLSVWKSQLSGAGLVDDFDYEKHTKPMTGEGQYFVANTATKGTSKKEIDAMIDARALDVQDEIVQEVDRQLDSIALTSEYMDDEIAQMLFGDFQEGEYEELNDDFVLDAARAPDGTKDDDKEFNFAAHVQELINKAKMESGDDDAAGIGGLSTINEHGKRDQDFFSNAKQINKKCNNNESDSGYFDEDDRGFENNYSSGIVPKLTSMEEEALCLKFNETLGEYDSDDLGEGCDDDDDVIGDRPLEGDKYVEEALDDYLQEKEDDIFMQGNRHYIDGQRHGGSGFSALVGTRMVPVKDIDPEKIDLSIRPMDEILGDADTILRNRLEGPPAEEIFIDGKSYFSEKMRNPWDCESILSTYSNLDNNPKTIGTEGRRRRRKPKKINEDDNYDESTASVQHIIQLSEKTGLPLGVLPTHGGCGFSADDMQSQAVDGTDTFMSVNKGEKRHKNESMEEKKLRKLNVKKERQLARMQKKMMKNAFGDEYSKRQQDLMVDDMGGKSVFRF